MFPYLNTNKHFLEQIKAQKLVDKLKIRVDEANWNMAATDVTDISLGWKNFWIYDHGKMRTAR